ncbi:MAG: hypothetical protein QGH93_01970 [Gammaproteobacteria bacterium]|nr:hypothetical protein [Gammaproteobacteria bacterium]
MTILSRWSVTAESLNGGQVRRLTFLAESRALSCHDVCSLWQHDTGFVDFFSKTLADMPFSAFFWEVCPISMVSVDTPFECVVVDSPVLSGVTADSGPFGSQLDALHSPDGIALFENLGGDALLIAPCTGQGAVAYAHLALFVRHAPLQLQRTFWARVGTALAASLASKPVWLSTSGLGVYWLHARLDQYPKYYTYAPYRQTGTTRG